MNHDHSDILEDLGRYLGIEREFYDLTGRVHRTTPEILNSLIPGLMGTEPSRLHEMFAEMRAREHSRIMEPVRVFQAGARKHSIPFRLPANQAGNRFRAVLTDERSATRLIDFQAQTDAAVQDGMTTGEIPLPSELSDGYYTLELPDLAHEPHSHGARTSLIFAPETCHLPREERVWGVRAHLYALHSENDMGAGDFGDAKRLLDLLAHQGAGVMGLNPMHALFPANPEHRSPYSPSNRHFLNLLYLDLRAVPEWQFLSETDFEPSTPSENPRVNHTRTVGIKLDVMSRLHRIFRERELSPDTRHGSRFRRFMKADGGRVLEHATFDALYEHFARESGLHGPSNWPVPFRDKDNSAVQEFARAHKERVELFVYIQWCLSAQWNCLERRARGSNLQLNTDMALGVDPMGSEVWSSPGDYASELSIGAPPDAFAPHGQDWGLVPFHPRALREKAYAPFIKLLRSNMARGGILRLDHVMGFQRLYCRARNSNGQPGAYINYPVDDLLGILALESRRRKCVIVGEDLGMVPEGFRERMDARGIHSWRVLYFEKESHGFRGPETYPDASAATVNTHDLPTLKGFWHGTDLKLREELDGANANDHGRARQEREYEKELLLRALHDSGSWENGRKSEREISFLDLNVAVHRFASRTPSRYVLVGLHDLLGMLEQSNLPGTVDEYDNWRIRCDIPLEDFSESAMFNAVLAVLRRERPRQS